MSPHRAAHVALAVQLLLLPTLAPEARAAEVRFDTDKRLDTKVTLGYPKTTVEAVLKALAGKTGVTLTAGRSQEDWLSRELPIALFVKDVPARTVLEQLPKLTDFHWTVTGEGDARAYQLWQDLKARQAQVEHAAAVDKQRQAERSRQGLLSLENMSRYGNMTPEAVEALKDKDPLGVLMASQPGFSSIPKLIGGLTQDQQMAATTEQGLRIPFSQLSPAMQQEVRNYVGGLNDLVRRVAPPEEVARLKESKDEDFRNSTFVIAPPKEGMGGVLDRQAMTGTITIDGLHNSAISDFPLFDPSTNMGRVFGNFVSELLQGTPMDQLGPRMQSEMGRALVKDALASQPPSESGDPALQAKVKLIATEGQTSLSLGDILKGLHEATGLAVLSDDLAAASIDGGAVAAGLSGELPASTVVAALKAYFGLECTHEGSLLRLRDVDWASKRDGLVPQAMMARWKAKAARGAQFTFRDLFEMSALTDAQIKGALRGDDDLRTLSYTLDGRTLAAVRLLASLSPQQDELLAEGESIPLESLTPSQSDLAAQMWAKQPYESTEPPPFTARGALKLDRSGTQGSGEAVSLGDWLNAMLEVTIRTGRADRPTDSRSAFISAPAMTRHEAPPPGQGTPAETGGPPQPK